MVTTMTFLRTAIYIAAWLLVTACTPQKEPEQNNLYGNALTSLDVGKQVMPNQEIRLPDDHLSHPKYKVEWWYLTANLFDQQGNQYPLQWTLFRFSGTQSSSAWHDNDQFMAHAKLMTKSTNWFSEKFARGGVGNAGVSILNDSNKFSAFIDDWQWLSSDIDLLPASLSFDLTESVNVNLSMSSSGPYVLNGNNGYSVKQQDGGHASMYYSQPFINISGTLQLPEKVVEVSGKGWFDHEWSARLTDENTAGWDWFSLHLSNNSKLMVFRVRHTKLADSWFGTYISGNGQKIHLDGQDIQASARTFKSIQGRQIPLTWDIQVPKHNIQLNITAFKDDQWNDALFSYYEGAVTIQGSHTGVGFMELTGY